ncbi:hypothetical protein GCM10011379_37410 [Filimonas zeae]|uniref:Uncharacterized protein n=1 Tax=Filimonas zeae TaxID=1737353 RepID=A0A917MXC4_9BACT|nr:hypothetical protein GCM10011379_37410 [Filimonas zeae]
MDQQALRELKVMQALRVYLDLLEPQGLQEQWDLRGRLGLREYQVYKVQLVRQGLQVPSVLLVLLDLRGRKGQKDLLVQLVLREMLVLRVYQGLWGQKELPVPQALLVLWVLPDLLVLLAPLVRRVWLVLLALPVL